MSKEQFPFVAADISSLAKSLRRELAELSTSPGHVEMLNMLARATGYRNFQHFRAECEARDRLEAEPVPSQPLNLRRVEATARCFDEAGRLARWPGKDSQRQLALWFLWSHIPARKDMSEKEVNAALNEWHTFGDHALLRRELFSRGMLFRTRDCSLYKRIELQPPPEALALIRHMGRRAEAC